MIIAPRPLARRMTPLVSFARHEETLFSARPTCLALDCVTPCVQMSRKGPRARRASQELRAERAGDRHEWLVPFLVALITFVVYTPALHNGFIIFDDDRNFVNNMSYRGLGLTELQWMWTAFHAGHYVPLTWMTLGLDFTLWGMSDVTCSRCSLLLRACLHTYARVRQPRCVLAITGFHWVHRRRDRLDRCIAGASATRVGEQDRRIGVWIELLARLAHLLDVRRRARAGSGDCA
jgi:hypothetical protein